MSLEEGLFMSEEKLLFRDLSDSIRKFIVDSFNKEDDQLELNVKCYSKSKLIRFINESTFTINKDFIQGEVLENYTIDSLVKSVGNTIEDFYYLTSKDRDLSLYISSNKHLSEDEDNCLNLQISKDLIAATISNLYYYYYDHGK